MGAADVEVGWKASSDAVGTEPIGSQCAGIAPLGRRCGLRHTRRITVAALLSKHAAWLRFSPHVHE
ncbi:hypothetical protein CH293_24475 [Rhodococcus sp. 14-2470-1b]|nr:hypothetical protein CH301_24700 [Rhodococcus sp. 15-1189-1-1a]OZF09683.1 hypothetical protein CH299_25220 [Rhodococcus sp. 14-2686-1-2]OZF44089.1 hypothetical protein CH293_24475 [Rhodococcus sp. 14-2470-1b]